MPESAFRLAENLPHRKSFMASVRALPTRRGTMDLGEFVRTTTRRRCRRLPTCGDGTGSQAERPALRPSGSRKVGTWRIMDHRWTAFWIGCVLTCAGFAQNPAPPVVPGRTWATLTPAAAGLDPVKLEALRDLVGGRGCVVRHAAMVYGWGDPARSTDVASALKPVLSTLLWFAIQDGKLPGPDAPVADFEPRLKALNTGKDAAITWRQLASQTSGYGLCEPPGAAYAYNDYAIALYYDTLTEKVFRQSGTEVLRTRLAAPLQFEDDCTFEAFGPRNRPGRLAVSVRDFARFGLLILRAGRWGDRQLLRPDFVRTMLHSPIPANLPRTSGVEADLLPGQRTLGGTRNITPVGPGYYSFNWWLNLTNRVGERLFVDAPANTFLAAGHGGKRCLWVFPSLDLIVSWNDSGIDDHDASPGNPNTKANRAARLMRESVLAP